jgi:hypothetical protein
LGICIAEKNGYGCSGGESIKNAGDKFWQIRLLSGSCTLGTAFSAGEVGQKILFGESNSWWTTINSYSHRFPVRFSKYANAKFSTVAIHSFSSLGF